MSKKVLIVDDEESIRKLLATRFEREGWRVDVAEDGAEAMESAQKNDYSVIVTDLKMPAMDGFQLIEKLRKEGVEAPVIMITGHGEKECAIEAMHKGAFDYLEKPFDMDEISLVVKRALDRDELRRQNERLLLDLKDANKKLKGQLEVKSELLERVAGDQESEIIIGRSQHVESLKMMIKTVAENFTGNNDPVVLVTGESGVGKEMVARFMHASLFTKAKPFVSINCAAFPENLLESELFGYEKGAFTGAVSRKLGLFELAGGGTLFLDEIGEMDLKMQAKMLRVLQERVIRRLGGTSDIAVKPHIVAATNRDLAKMVSEGKFREDLYYRLSTLPIAVAPLRSRTDDIEVLAHFFLNKLSTARGKRFDGFTAGATKAMASYRWPGNVRELRSVIERAVILEKGPMLELSQLRHETMISVAQKDRETMSIGNTSHGQTKSGMGTGTNRKLNGDAMVFEFPKFKEKSLSELRKELDEKVVRQVLIDSLTTEYGNVSAVARNLKLDRANLLRLLRRFAIDPELFRNADQKAS